MHGDTAGLGLFDRRLHLFLPALFLLVAGQLGTFLALAVPLGQVADEIAHVIRAESLQRGELVGRRDMTRIPADGALHLQQGLDGHPGLQMVGSGSGPLTLADADAARAMPWYDAKFLPLGTIASYWPVFYLPSAAGVGLARLASLSPYQAFRLARMADLAAFLAVGTAALTLARRGQALLFCTLILPMTLSLAASVNQDGLLIAASALAAALLTRQARGARLLAAALLGSIAMAKPPYLPLAGLLLLPFPPWRRRGEWLERLGLVALVAGATLAWVWVIVHDVATPVFRTAAEAGPLWPGPRPAVFAGTDMAAQLRVLSAKPTRLLTLPWRSMRHDTDLWRQAIGIFGRLDVHLPSWLYRLWAVAVVAAALADLAWRRPGAATLPARQAAWPLLCVAATWFAVYLSQYLSWVPVGSTLIDGPQGRYFLPLLPALALALPSLGRVPAVWGAGALLPVAACLASAATLPLVMLRFYYLH